MRSSRLYDYVQQVARQEREAHNTIQAGGLIVYAPQMYQGKLMQLIAVDHNRGDVVAEEPILQRGEGERFCCAVFTGIRPGCYLPVVNTGGLLNFLARAAFSLVPTLEPKNFIAVTHDSITTHDLR